MGRPHTTQEHLRDKSKDPVGYIASVCTELQYNGFDNESRDLRGTLQNRYRRLGDLHLSLSRHYHGDPLIAARDVPADMRALVAVASTESKALRTEIADLEAQVKRVGGSVFAENSFSPVSPRLYVDNLLRVGNKVEAHPWSDRRSAPVNVSIGTVPWTPSTASPLSTPRTFDLGGASLMTEAHSANRYP